MRTFVLEKQGNRVPLDCGCLFQHRGMQSNYACGSGGGITVGQSQIQAVDAFEKEEAG
jgi:hypothetical protein